ncbi:hypothetical protein [Nocardia sp. NPDC003979]
MSTTDKTVPRRPLSAWWGVGAGFVIAVFVLVPAVICLRRYLDVPELSAVPSHLRERPPDVHPAYWLTWKFVFTTMLVPGPMLALWSTTRRTGIGYAITAAVIGGSLMAMTMSFELGGFASS